VSGKEIAKAFVWLLATLCLVSLLSPLGQTHDEAYHMRSIWCGHGEREVYCPERFINDQGALVARTNIEIGNCQKSIREPLLCPTDQSGESIFRTNDGLYPDLFYFALSWFVVSDVESSVVMMRMVSASVVVVMLGVLMWLLPPRYRIVQLLVLVTGFTATGYFLFASINPSSWTALGVGFGWMPVHAVLVKNHLSRRRRAALVAVAFITWTLAIGSRSDGTAFVAFTLVATLAHASWRRYPTKRRELLAAVTLLAIVAFTFLEMVSKFPLVDSLKRLYTFTDGQRDNITFFSENLLQAIPDALRALGSVPTMTGITLPDIVLTASLILLGFYGVRTFNRREKFQVVGMIVSVVVIGLFGMAQIALVDFRDSGAIEPRYFYPLMLFALGWWFVLGPEDLVVEVEKSLLGASVVVTIMFFFTTFTLAERYVDVQTSGLRYLPEGPDQWWWSWMPFGPNVTVLLAAISLWHFLKHLRRLLFDRERALM